MFDMIAVHKTIRIMTVNILNIIGNQSFDNIYGKIDTLMRYLLK